MLREVSSGAVAYFVEEEAVAGAQVVSEPAAHDAPRGQASGRDGVPRARILMIFDANGRWTFPKGIVEEGETVERAALRELREETGIGGEIEESLGRVHYFYQSSGNGLVSKTVHYFLVRSGPCEPVPLESEIRDARWMDVAEARRMNGYPNNLDVLERAVGSIERRLRA